MSRLQVPFKNHGYDEWLSLPMAKSQHSSHFKCLIPCSTRALFNIAHSITIKTKIKILSYKCESLGVENVSEKGHKSEYYPVNSQRVFAIYLLFYHQMCLTWSKLNGNMGLFSFFFIYPTIAWICLKPIWETCFQWLDNNLLGSYRIVVLDGLPIWL